MSDTKDDAIKEAAIKLDVSKLDSQNDDDLKTLKTIDPRYVGKDSVIRTHEYKKGANYIKYDQFGDEIKKEVINQINEDLNRIHNSKIVVNDRELDLKKEVEKYVNNKQELVEKVNKYLTDSNKNNYNNFSQKFNHITVKSYLKEKHKLSDNQVNFILAASLQGSLAAGTKAALTEFNDNDGTTPQQQNNSSFVLEINNNKCRMLKSANIHYLSNNLGTEDFNQTQLVEFLKNDKSPPISQNNVSAFLNNIGNFVTTNDSIIANVRVDLGALGAKTEPTTTLELCAKGECCNIINNIKEIQEYTEVEKDKVKEDLNKFEEITSGKEKYTTVKELVKKASKENSDKEFKCELIEVNTTSLELSKKLASTLSKKFTIINCKTNKSRQELAVDLATELKNLEINKSHGYLERFSKKIVNDFATTQGINIKQGIFSSLVSRFKDKINGYTNNNVPKKLNTIQEYLNNALAKEPLTQLLQNGLSDGNLSEEKLNIIDNILSRSNSIPNTTPPPRSNSMINTTPPPRSNSKTKNRGSSFTKY